MSENEKIEEHLNIEKRKSLLINVSAIELCKLLEEHTKDLPMPEIPSHWLAIGWDNALEFAATIEIKELEEYRYIFKKVAAMEGVTVRETMDQMLKELDNA